MISPLEGTLHIELKTSGEKLDSKTHLYTRTLEGALVLLGCAMNAINKQYNIPVKKLAAMGEFAATTNDKFTTGGTEYNIKIPKGWKL